MSLIKISEQQQRLSTLIENRKRQAGARNLAQHIGLSSIVCKNMAEALKAGAPLDREKVAEVLGIASTNLDFGSNLVGAIETTKRR